MNHDSFCPECHKTVPIQVEIRQETTIVRGLPVLADHPVSICSICKAEFATANQMDEGLTNSYDAYRKQTGVIAPEDIIQLRKRYGASQKALGIILGFGELTINTYEKGSLPSEAHQKVLEAAKDSTWFRQQFAKAKNRLGQTQIRRIEQAFAGLPEKSFTEIHNRQYPLDQDPSTMVGEEATEYTGWVKPQFEKMLAMIIHVLSHVRDVYKMKLLKMLFYADFVHYQKTSHAISGWRYARLPYGPVPQDYETVLYHAWRMGVVTVQPDKEERGELFSAGPQASLEFVNLLTPEELSTLETICKKLGHYKASHRKRSNNYVASASVCK